MLKVKLIDGSNRTVLIDDSSLLGEILAAVCKKVQINNPDEYGLRLESKEDSTSIDSRPFLSPFPLSLFTKNHFPQISIFFKLLPSPSPYSRLWFLTQFTYDLQIG